jgi:hypothetical protein
MGLGVGRGRAARPFKLWRAVSKPLQTLAADGGIGEHDASVPPASHMKIIDRATRGMAARFLWGGLVVLFLIGLFLARSERTTALNTQIQDAQDRATAYARTTVADHAVIDPRAGTITFDTKGFAVAVEGDIFTDPTVARVRVWDRDGLLLASSDPSEVVGQLATAQDANFSSVIGGATHHQLVQENFTFSTVGAPTSPTDILEVFTPLQTKDNVEPLGVVQIDLLYAKLEAAAATPWSTLSLVCIIGAIIAGLLFVVAMVRKPVRAEGAEGAHVDTTAPDVVAEPPAAVPTSVARDRELEEELKVAREQLQQASEAFAFLEARVKDGSGAQATAADIDAAVSRISELEAALQRAEQDAAEARSSSVSQEELDRVRRDADARVAELERQMHEDAAKVDPELEVLRAQLAESEQRAKAAERSIAAARADVDAAREEVVTAPNGEVSDGLIEELEAKVAEAEARAKEAEEEALRITPEANDLRARLAQAAARKKLGPSG